MSELAAIPGLSALWQRTRGTAQVSVAILDGLVDTNHPCFQEADLRRLTTLVKGEAIVGGSMSAHGTHIASVIFGTLGSPIEGLVPHCRGMIVPVFDDTGRKRSQLDLARAIEQAAENGAQVINISGGALTDVGEAEDWLDRAVKMCRDRNILVVAAAGNDGCHCLHVPAAIPSVLAVGAMDSQGQPLNFSNWGETYQYQGILAPGENILGAKPGGGTQRLSGTSFAAPIVTGVVALLLSLQVQRGETPNPLAVREALIATALPCNLTGANHHRQCLVGVLNIPGAVKYLTGEIMSESLENTMVDASDCGCGGVTTTVEPTEVEVIPQSETTTEVQAASVTSQEVTVSEQNMTISNPVTPSQQSQSAQGMVYAIGTLGYDFGTEARRDSFKQLMPAVDLGGTLVPGNPYDARQMVDYLGANLSEARSLIWTLNLELTPIYAIEPSGSFARDVYELLQQLLAGEVQAEDNENYIERVSIPGRLTGRTVRLFSGQIVPVIEPQSPRGMYGWKVNTLVTAAMAAVSTEREEADEGNMRRSLSSFLNRIYYDLRNLGQTSQDRALNFTATNAFQAAQTFSEAVGTGMELESINVQKSPFCRMDSDCWDVQLKFFDPENRRRARKIFRFTIDVSDLIPVTLGEVRSWSSPN